MMVIELNKKNDCLDPNVMRKIRYEEDGERKLAFWLQLLTLFHLNQPNYAGPTFQKTIIGSEKLFSILFDVDEEIAKKSIETFVENEMIYVSNVITERRYDPTENFEESCETLKKKVREHNEEKYKESPHRNSHSRHNR